MIGKTAGVDEAGRGPVFGPMVVACVTAPSERLGIGAKDSKKLTPAARRRLVRRIMSDPRLSVDVEIVWPWEIDREGVAEAEFRAVASLVRRCGARRVILDKPGNYDDETLLRKLRPPEGVEIIAEERADDRYEVVSAASIVAKTYRDWIVENLERLHGPVGSGYPTDPKTIERLEREISEDGPLHDMFRRSWSTYRRVERKVSTKTLDEFLRG